MYNIRLSWQKFETQLEGNPVTMEVKPLSVKKMMALAPYITKAMGATNSLETQIITGLELQQFFADNLFDENVRNVQGITIEDRPLTKEDFANESVLCTLVGEITGHLATISTLSRDERKN
jgi:hypothetical protein